MKIQSLVDDTNLLKFAPEILGLPIPTMSDVLTIVLSVVGVAMFIIILLLLCSLMLCIRRRKRCACKLDM